MFVSKSARAVARAKTHFKTGENHIEINLLGGRTREAGPKAGKEMYNAAEEHIV